MSDRTIYSSSVGGEVSRRPDWPVWRMVTGLAGHRGVATSLVRARVSLPTVFTWRLSESDRKKEIFRSYLP